MKLRSLAAVSALALAGTGTLAQTVKLEFDEEADFGSFRTYAWKDTQEPAAPPLDHQALALVIERELAAKGFVKVTSGPPDVLVRYFAKVGKRTKSTGRTEEGLWQPSDRRTVVECSRVEELKLILELYAPAGLEPAWSAAATEPLAPPDRLEKQIDQTVARLLARYPPKSR